MSPPTVAPNAANIVGSILLIIRSAKLCNQERNLTQTPNAKCDGYEIWGIICGCVSCLVGGYIFIATMIDAGWVSKKIAIFTNLFLLLWNAGGVATLTFDEPFNKILGNGYFGIWISFIGASMLLMGTVRTQFENLNIRVPNEGAWKPFIILNICGLVVMVQSAIDCDKTGSCRNQQAWILACSCISFFASGVLFYATCKTEAVRGVWGFASVFQLVLWVAAAGVGTFDKPYTELGNGYMGIWLALASSVRLVALCYFSARVESPEEKNTGKPDPEIDAITGSAGHSAMFAAANKTLFGIVFSSLMVLIASCQECHRDDCTGREIWAVVCSSTSVGIAVFLALSNKFILFGAHEKVATAIFCLFLLLLWSAGVYTMTFEAPFKADAQNLPGNGYFGAWICFLMSLYLFFHYGPHFDRQLKALEGHGWQWALIVGASLILAVQATIDCFEEGLSCGSDTNYTYAIVVGWVGMLSSLIVLALGEKIVREEYSLALRIISVCQLVWWAVAAGFLTFEKPYTTPGNGYFATLVATTLSAGSTAKNFCVYVEAKDDSGAMNEGEHGDGEESSYGETTMDDGNDPY
eukprot:Hpha_TRINITY_DN13978_c0_g1::TRINITY_DN13978_c0_g1_i1::g.35886::m.35886